MAFHEVEYYDRKAVSIPGEYIGNTVAPHAATVRRTYTCPPDRKAIVELIELEVVRISVAAPVGIAQAYALFTPAAGTPANTVLVARIRTNVAEDMDSGELQTAFSMHEGDRLDLMTIDLSTGGTCQYLLSFKLTEFDAYLYVDPQKTIPEPRGPDVQEPKREPGLIEWLKELFMPKSVM